MKTDKRSMKRILNDIECGVRKRFSAHLPKEEPDKEEALKWAIGFLGGLLGQKEVSSREIRRIIKSSVTDVSIRIKEEELRVYPAKPIQLPNKGAVRHLDASKKYAVCKVSIKRKSGFTATVYIPYIYKEYRWIPWPELKADEAVSFGRRGRIEDGIPLGDYFLEYERKRVSAWIFWAYQEDCKEESQSCKKAEEDSNRILTCNIFLEDFSMTYVREQFSDEIYELQLSEKPMMYLGKKRHLSRNFLWDVGYYGKWKLMCAYDLPVVALVHKSVVKNEITAALLLPRHEFMFF